mmetsp:Transcript_111135/g.227477  ORF Transcript_111135/g.227477 Transcript_111135/m.227477 type:complete len:244 (+) Transcript_111135:1222-1953(+)
MVCCRLHATCVGGLEGSLRRCKLLPGLGEVGLGPGLGLCGNGLCRRFLALVLLIRRPLVLQGLLQHRVVVLRVHFRLPQAGELLLRLILQVLKCVQDAGALRLVDRSLWRTQFAVLVAALVGLHEGHKALPVGVGETGCIDHRAQRLQQARSGGTTRLGHGGGVLLHLAPDDAHCPTQRVDHLKELLLAGGKVSRLLLPNQGGVFQLSRARPHSGRKVLDLRVGSLDVTAELGDLRLKLLLLR